MLVTGFQSYEIKLHNISLEENNLRTFVPDEIIFNHINPVDIILDCNALQRWINNG